jgi:hypothetical protein
MHSSRNEKTLKQIFEKTKLHYFHFDKIKYYYACKTLNIKDWGRHKVLAIKTENGDDLKYYITNKLDMKPENKVILILFGIYMIYLQYIEQKKLKLE